MNPVVRRGVDLGVIACGEPVLPYPGRQSDDCREKGARRMLLTITTTHRPATRPRLPAAQAPRTRSRATTSASAGRTSSTPRLVRRSLHRLPAARRGSGGDRPGQGIGRGPALAVRQRPALRRLLVPQRGDRAGLRLGPPGPLQGPARADDARNAAIGPDRRAPRAGRRADSSGAVFEPLGYVVEAERHPLDERFPEWGEGPYFSVTISQDGRRSPTC